MENLLFSTILYVDSQEKLEEALLNLNQQSTFRKKGQLIVVDPHESEETAARIAELSNALYFSAPEAEVGEAYELGMAQAEGRWLNFTLASATFSDHAYDLAADVLESNQTAVSLKPIQCDTDTGFTRYKGAFDPRCDIDLVNLVGPSNEILVQPMLQAYFFPAELVKSYHFQPGLHDDALYRFLMEYQMDYPQFCYLKQGKFIYTITREDNTSTNPLQYQPWWYQPSVENFILPFLEEIKAKRGEIPQFVQMICYYLLYTKYNCNMNDRSKGTLSGKEEALAFAEATFRACALLDPATILRHQLTPHMQASRVVRFFLMRGRTAALGRDYRVTTRNKRFLLQFPRLDGVEEEAVPEHPFSRISKEVIRIRIMNYNHGVLQIDANVGLKDFINREEYEVYAVVSSGGVSTTYPAEQLGIYPLTKCFGVTMARKHAIQFHIPIAEKSMKIRFFFRFQEQDYPFQITFATPNSRIDANNKYGYWLFGENKMLLRKDEKTLTIRNRRRRFHIKRELLFWREAWKQFKNKQLVLHGLVLRLLFWLLRGRYAKKHVWVTFDKQYKAGDNGEYMYQYLRENAPDVEPYYIIKRDSLDYPRLVKQDRKHILVYGTLRCQLICVLAEAYLGTHANISAQYNTSTAYRMFTKDIQQGQYICIQHGLTIQKIAQYQNRQFDNIRLYCLASPYELKNLSHPFYDYKPEELKMTGLARYDGLKNNDQKIILITPTWRKNIVNSNVANNKKTHNSNFKNSAYFRIYNNLINDPTLIDCAKRNGYRIIYLLHPAMSAQLEDFDRNEFVELMPATGDMSYEKILTESSLMVTDYSGVQFDFAYMRKCLVYYHPDELPPHYDAGGLIYETMGFGPICRNHEQIVHELCAAMERQCTTEPEYIRRADDFFAFSDHNNCERIYHVVKDWLAEQ